jgi:hypothetical protein
MHAPSGIIDVLPFCSHSTCLFSGVKGAHAATPRDQPIIRGRILSGGKQRTSRVEVSDKAQVRVEQRVSELELLVRRHREQQIKLRPVLHWCTAWSAPTAIRPLSMHGAHTSQRGVRAWQKLGKEVAPCWLERARLAHKAPT